MRTFLYPVPAGSMKVLFSMVAIAALLLSPSVAPAGPIPLTKCQVIDKSGSYVLTGNIIDPPHSGPQIVCLEVSVPDPSADVTIDMNGFAMIGSGKDLAIGSAGFQPVTLLNGVITHFSNALDIANYSRVDGVVVENCSEGADVVASSVANSRFLNNRAFGLDGGAVTAGNIASANGIGIGSGAFVAVFNTVHANSGGNINVNKVQGTPCTDTGAPARPGCVEYGNETQ